MATDWDAALRAQGYRITPQRQLVLRAVEELQHATPEEILAEVQKTASGVNLSTVYRTLEVLEEVGLVSHAHLGHGAPTYHARTEHLHVHLVCSQCGDVQGVDADVALTMVVALQNSVGFETDVSHLSLQGTLREVRAGLTPVPAPEGSADSGVPWHYGEPFAEQRRLAAGEAVVDLSHRGVITVTGPDRLSWLHSLTTQHVSDLAPQAWTLALILSPHGHVEHELHMVDDGETTWITCEPGTAESLRAYLDGMRFMLRVEVADVSADYGVIYDSGEVIVPRDELESRLGDERAGTWALEALRVAAGVPRLAHETDHRTIPHEVGWIGSAVHLQKGCYRGQETVARVQNLGRPPRRMVLLHLDGSDNRMPAHLDPVVFDAKEIGWIGTAVQHYELGPIATAIIKRTVPENADLIVRTPEGEVAARAEEF